MNAWKLPGRARIVNEPIESVAAAPKVGRGQREFARPGVSSHGDAGRSDNGPLGGCRRASLEKMKGHWRDRDARPAMLLSAVHSRRLSTRSSLSKSVPCNIIVTAAGPWPAIDYLKPKVFLGRPSTRVAAPSEKNVVAYNSAAMPRFPCLFALQKGHTRHKGMAPFQGAARRI
jgi:hypothetical protein